MLLFFRTMFAMLFAEMGDKTQLLSASLVTRYRLRYIIAGIGLAVLALNGVAIVLGAALGHMLPIGWLKLFAGGAFFLFAMQTLTQQVGQTTGEKHAETHRGKGPASAVFVTFFLAELGDKTQLTAITFAANEGGGLRVSLIVWLACCVGLFLADLIGVLVGYVLNSRLPAHVMQWLSGLVFVAFGVITVWQGASILFAEVWIVWLFPFSAFLLFVFGCMLRRLYLRRQERSIHGS